MGKTNVYKAAGFTLLNKLDESGLLTKPVKSGNNIAKGDALHNVAGYVSNAIVEFTDAFLGIAAHDADNSAGGDGTIDVKIIPPLEKYQFIVPVEDDALVTLADVGVICDLQSANTVDINDTTGATNAKGLLIDEIDVSAEAVAVNTRGYVIGHFVAHTT